MQPRFTLSRRTLLHRLGAGGAVVATFMVPKSFAATAAKAPPPQDPKRKPLVVIRFNQKRVYFDRALRSAVSRAEVVKPDAIYDIVSVLPQPKEGDVRQRDAEMMKQNQIAVMQAMREMQIPEGRLRQAIRSEEGLGAQEVRVYVQ